MKRKIIIGSTYPLISKKVQEIFEGTGNYEVLLETDSGYELLDNFNEYNADLLFIIDGLNDICELDLIRGLKKNKNNIEIMIMKDIRYSSYLDKVNKYGVDIIMPLKINENEFLNTLEKQAYKKDRCENLNINIVNEKNLTKRQEEILCYFAKGFTNKQISEKLNLSIRTVEHHKETIKIKLGSYYKNYMIESIKNR